MSWWALLGKRSCHGHGMECGKTHARLKWMSIYLISKCLEWSGSEENGAFLPNATVKKLYCAVRNPILSEKIRYATLIPGPKGCSYFSPWRRQSLEIYLGRGTKQRHSTSLPLLSTSLLQYFNATLYFYFQVQVIFSVRLYNTVMGINSYLNGLCLSAVITKTIPQQ